VLFTRRATVVGVMGIAYLYHLDISQTAPLVKSGIITIALLSQTLPIIIGGLHWQKRNKTAAMIALISGALCWAYWLLWPSITASYYFDPPPDDLQLASGFVISLLVNLFCFVYFSLILPANKEQQIGDQKEHEFSRLNQATKISKLLAITEKVLDKDRHQYLLNNLPIEQRTTNSLCQPQIACQYRKRDSQSSGYRQCQNLSLCHCREKRCSTCRAG